jgi:hypothetical protein
MKKTLLLFLPALIAFNPIQSSAQESNSWGDSFACAVDWFGGCKAVLEDRIDQPINRPAARGNASSLSGVSTTPNLPLPVRNVLDNPSPETARAYVLWSRQANERLAKASEYIAQATREINSDAVIFGNTNEKINDLALAGVGPVGLYYFFSPFDPTAAKDVAVLNNIWREGRIGVVGIPVSGKDEEIRKYVGDAKPLFPVRRSDAEVTLVKPAETPDLYLALPLEKKIFRLGPTISETTITETIGSVLAAQRRGRVGLDSLVSDR